MVVNSLLKDLNLRWGRSISSDFLGMMQTQLKGHGLEFRESRPYVVGDSMRYIDHKTSAKTGEMRVKEFDEERGVNVWFVESCSLHPQPLSRSESGACLPGSRREKVREVMYVLGYAILKNGDRIGMIDGDETIGLNAKRETLAVLVDPRGKNQASRLERWWSNVRYVMWGGKQGKREGGEEVNRKLQQIVAMRVRSAVIVIVTDALKVNEALVREVGERNEIVWVHVFREEEMYLHGEGKFLEIGGIVVDVSDRKQTIRNQKLEYQHLIEERLGQMNRMVQSVGGRYVMVTTRDEVVEKLMEMFA